MLLLHFDMFYMIFLNQIIEKILKNHLNTIQIILVTQYCMQKLWKKSCLYDSYLFIIANIYDDKYLSNRDWDSLMKQYFNNISNSGLSLIFFLDKKVVWCVCAVCNYVIGATMTTSTSFSGHFFSSIGYNQNQLWQFTNLTVG